jgi:hypothetical protein
MSSVRRWFGLGKAVRFKYINKEIASLSLREVCSVDAALENGSYAIIAN